MLFLDSFGKNVYIDDQLAGYISPDSGDMFANGYKFGSLTEYGEIYLQNEYVGYIEDNGDIYIGEFVGGYVSPSGDLHFDSAALKQRKDDEEDY